MFNSIFVSRITELSTYGGMLLILSHFLPFSACVIFGALMIFCGDKTLQAVIMKVAPGLKAILEQTAK